MKKTPKNTKSRGYKPQVVMDFLQINQETLRIWRDKAYPKNSRSLFTAHDVFIFRIIKEILYNKDARIRGLAKLNWKDFHKSLKKNGIVNYANKLVSVDCESNEILISDSAADLDFSRRGAHHFDLTPLVHEQMSAYETIGLI